MHSRGNRFDPDAVHMKFYIKQDIYDGRWRIYGTMNGIDSVQFGNRDTYRRAKMMLEVTRRDFIERSGIYMRIYEASTR